MPLVAQGFGQQQGGTIDEDRIPAVFVHGNAAALFDVFAGDGLALWVVDQAALLVADGVAGGTEYHRVAERDADWLALGVEQGLTIAGLQQVTFVAEAHFLRPDMALENLVFALERGEYHPQERHERSEAEEDQQPVAQRVNRGRLRDFGHAPFPLS